ncbi:MAG: glycosyltransferase [Elusimicrobiota bacterium]
MEKIKALLLGDSLEDAVNDYAVGVLGTLRRNIEILTLDYKKLYCSHGLYGMQEYIKTFIEKNNINTIFYWPGPANFDFNVHFFEKLRRNCFVVMWIGGDTEHYFEGRDQYYAQAMDYVINDELIAPYKFNQIGIASAYFPNACDREHYHKIEGLKLDTDVSFIGLLSDKIGRREYVKYLEENSVNIKTYGVDSVNGTISREEKVALFNRTKINLNFTGTAEVTRLTRNNRINRRKKQVKGRVIEITLSGGFVLSEYVPSLEHLFVIGKEIDVFYDKEELLEKVRYYLNNEEQRVSIAQCGYDRSVKDYDIQLAVPRLLAKLEEYRANKKYRPSEIYLDPEFIRNYSTYRIHWILKFLKASNLNLVFEELKIVMKYMKIDWYQVRVFFIEEILDNFPKLKSVLKRIVEGKQKV